jgi:hypothetical protein
MLKVRLAILGEGLVGPPVSVPVQLRVRRYSRSSLGLGAEVSAGQSTSSTSQTWFRVQNNTDHDITVSGSTYNNKEGWSDGLTFYLENTAPTYTLVPGDWVETWIRFSGNNANVNWHARLEYKDPSANLISGTLGLDGTTTCVPLRALAPVLLDKDATGAIRVFEKNPLLGSS